MFKLKYQQSPIQTSGPVNQNVAIPIPKLSVYLECSTPKRDQIKILSSSSSWSHPRFIFSAFPFSPKKNPVYNIRFHLPVHLREKAMNSLCGFSLFIHRSMTFFSPLRTNSVVFLSRFLTNQGLYSYLSLRPHVSSHHPQSPDLPGSPGFPHD